MFRLLQTEILSNYWLLGAFEHALNWHCQLLEPSKLAVPVHWPFFLRSKLASSHYWPQNS